MTPYEPDFKPRVALISIWNRVHRCWALPRPIIPPVQGLRHGVAPAWPLDMVIMTSLPSPSIPSVGVFRPISS